MRIYQVCRHGGRPNDDLVDCYFGISRKEAFKILRKKRATLKRGTVSLFVDGRRRLWDTVMGY